MNIQVSDSVISLLKSAESKIKRPHVVVDGVSVTIDDYKPVYMSSPGKEVDEVVRDWIVLFSACNLPIR
jgi:hypothetical protein